MRYRSGVFALTALLALACAAPPAAASPPPPASIDSAPAIDNGVLVLPTQLSASESLHVYLLTQLAVSDAVSRDSAALQQLVTHAAHTLMAAYAAEQIPIARGTAFVRQSEIDRVSPTSRTGLLPLERRLQARAAWAAYASLPRPPFVRLTRL